VEKFVVIIIGMSSIQYKYLLSPKSYTFGSDAIDGVEAVDFATVCDSTRRAQLIFYN
jgi:hypothetical protein